MPKDTKSLDNNKAPACESRGFVHKKKEGVHFDTPSSYTYGKRGNYLPESFSFKAANSSMSPKVVFSIGVLITGASSSLRLLRLLAFSRF